MYYLFVAWERCLHWKFAHVLYCPIKIAFYSLFLFSEHQQPTFFRISFPSLNNNTNRRAKAFKMQKHIFLTILNNLNKMHLTEFMINDLHKIFFVSFGEFLTLTYTRQLFWIVQYLHTAWVESDRKTLTKDKLSLCISNAAIALISDQGQQNYYKNVKLNSLT